jgi:hypothetical protein
LLEAVGFQASPGIVEVLVYHIALWNNWFEELTGDA